MQQVVRNITRTIRDAYVSRRCAATPLPASPAMSTKQRQAPFHTMLLLGVLLVSATIITAEPIGQVTTTTAAKGSEARKLLQMDAPQECPTECFTTKPLYVTACRAGTIEVGTISAGSRTVSSTGFVRMAGSEVDKQLFYQADNKPVEIIPGMTLTIWRVPPYRGWQVLNMKAEQGTCMGTGCHPCCGKVARYTARFFC